MPLAFLNYPTTASAIVFNKEERKVAEYIYNLSVDSDPTSNYAVTVDVDVRFSRSKDKDEMRFKPSNDPDAPKMQLTEKQFKDKYPFTYKKLTEECRRRYVDFKVNQHFHNLRLPLKSDPKYCRVRHLDPDNPKSTIKIWYSEAVFSIFDQYYTKRSQ